MSASPIARQATQSQSIPTKKVLYKDSSELPIDYSSTPGGTLYSTTPGGTRIVYERSMLMHLKNSPLSHTPPKNLFSIPESMLKSPNLAAPVSKVNGHVDASPVKKVSDGADDENDQFEMDM